MRTERRSHRQIGITKLIVAFRNSVNAPKKVGYDGNRAPVWVGGHTPLFFN